MRYAADAEFLRKLPQYLALGRFSATPEKDDMRGFELEPDDIKELRACKPGKCEVQLPDVEAAGFTQGIDWKRSDVAQPGVGLAGGKVRITPVMPSGNSRPGTNPGPSPPVLDVESYRLLNASCSNR